MRILFQYQTGNQMKQFGRNVFHVLNFIAYIISCMIDKNVAGLNTFNQGFFSILAAPIVTDKNNSIPLRELPIK